MTKMAIQDYSAAIDLSPRTVYYWNRHLLYQDLGQLKEAIFDLKAIITIDSNDSEARKSLNILLLKFRLKHPFEKIKKNSASINKHPEDNISKIKALHQLFENGIISQSEFEKSKSKLLDKL